MAVTQASELQPVAAAVAKLRTLLDLARSIRPNDALISPLQKTSDLTKLIESLDEDIADTYDQAYRFSAVETAAREIFYALVSNIGIEDPAFVEVWNLFDILLFCGDMGQCTPELVCWLLEELLDSQTTQGCRIVFDYLESRRESLARKDFHKKNLVFLRSCNELLRRLSRAEDAIFCGRVFFFLFQTFPLGDKSSVNLRGEFHVENTTKFEVPADQHSETMDIDPEPAKKDEEIKEATPQPPTRPGGKAIPSRAAQKKTKEIKSKEEEILSASDLYPIFWRLQQDFSDPTRLFLPSNFRSFKQGLVYTITKFTKSTTVQTKSGENDKRGVKRKLGNGERNGINGRDEDVNFVDTYNPKYLTSRDLFDLELSDLAFQRHILVQATILIEFLLSLTEAAKKRLASPDATNKSLLYAFTFSTDDVEWAYSTRSSITTYLKKTTEGALFSRMVDTVLARDKNWVRWKIESCPSIVLDPAATELDLEARKGARDATKPRRIPDRQVGAMDLSFLSEGDGGGLETLRDPARFTVSTMHELIEAMKTDELDMDFAVGEEKEGLENAIANKRWRALRQARSTRLSSLDNVDPRKKLEDVFTPSESERAHRSVSEVAAESDLEADPGTGPSDVIDEMEVVDSAAESREQNADEHEQAVNEEMAPEADEGGSSAA